MGNELEAFLSSCSKFDFGPIHLTGQERDFYKVFNREIISLCDSLPESTQTDALLFFMTYSGLSIGQELDFFKNYYVPSWSAIYWLAQYSPDDDVLSQADIKNAITAHSMAMILHSLDDHINDQQVPAAHLTLLLRSQLWMNMMEALKNLSFGIDKGEKIVKDFIDVYYSAIIDSNNIETLDCYCDLFKKQMATWLIVPVLMTKKITADDEFTEAIQTAYESFGIAWRLLDDIQDLEIDMREGSHSSVYFCLTENGKSLWDKNSRSESENEKFSTGIIHDHILKKSIIYRLQQRICNELESAVSIYEDCNIVGLSKELGCLLKSFKHFQDSI